MRYIRRELEAQIVRAVRAFPALMLTGPRRAGKTWLLRHLFPTASYFLREDPDMVARLRSDPQRFRAGGKPARPAAQQDQPRRSAGSERAYHRAVARSAGGDGADPHCSAVLREPRQTADQIPKSVRHGLWPRMSLAGHRIGSGARQV